MGGAHLSLANHSSAAGAGPSSLVPSAEITQKTEAASWVRTSRSTHLTCSMYSPCPASFIFRHPLHLPSSLQVYWCTLEVCGQTTHSCKALGQLAAGSAESVHTYCEWCHWMWWSLPSSESKPSGGDPVLQLRLMRARRPEVEPASGHRLPARRDTAAAAGDVDEAACVAVSELRLSELRLHESTLVQLPLQRLRNETGGADLAVRSASGGQADLEAAACSRASAGPTGVSAVEDVGGGQGSASGGEHSARPDACDGFGQISIRLTYRPFAVSSTPSPTAPNTALPAVPPAELHASPIDPYGFRVHCFPWHA